MEEEKKEITGSKVNNNKIIVIILIVIGLILIGIGSYKLLTKESGDNGTPGSTPTPIITPNPTVEPIGKNESGLSNEEIIKIAKEKLGEAEAFSRDWESSTGEEYKNTSFFYNDTIENFRNIFYSLYSKNLVYNDVMVEYKNPEDYTNWTTNVFLEGDMLSGIPAYSIIGNKVYRDSCNIGSGELYGFDKFVVQSGTTDILKINYVVIGKDPDDPDSKEYERGTAEMTLVKEDGKWKILKATIADMCHGDYVVGK